MTRNIGISDIQDRKQLFVLYHTCFPDNVREEAVVEEILTNPDDHVFGIYDGDMLTSACLVHGRAVTMLATLPKYRNRGYAERLLTVAEQEIKEQGFHKLTIGVGTDNMYLMPGVPMNDGADQFFRKRGYTHSWGETGCFDMKEDLTDFSYTGPKIGESENGVTCRWATIQDLPEIRRCVADAEEGFVQYYMEEDHYREGTKTPVLVAQQNGEILGTLIVSIEVEGKGRGSVGCTATRTDARGRGIATRLVRLGTGYLKEAGMQEAFLGYTYTEILHMYARAGYKVSQEYFMAVKEL